MTENPIEKLSSIRQNAQSERRKLARGVVVLLLSICILAWWLSLKITDMVLQSFFINISAGFFGAAFTFVVLTHFEQQKLHYERLERMVQLSSHAVHSQQQLRDVLSDSKHIIENVHRLTKYIDVEKNPARTEEILSIQAQIITYAMANVDEQIRHGETQVQSARDALSYAIEIGDESIIDSVREYYQSSVNLLAGISKNRESMQSVLKSSNEVRTRFHDYNKKLGDIDLPDQID